jgi:hypothetical protein
LDVHTEVTPRGLGLKVAIIDVEGNRDRYQFFEDVAVNMGLDLRVFSSANNALHWLHRAKRPHGE